MNKLQRCLKNIPGYTGSVKNYCESACFVHYGRFNKDHKRMMVDAMLMIVLDLRSFLTAITPNVVAQTAVTL